MEMQYIIFGAYTLAFVAVFVYQANRYSSLEESLKALNEMLDSIGKYKDIFKPDEIIDNMNTKHKLEREVSEQSWEKKMNDKLNEQKFGLSQELIPRLTSEFLTMHKDIIERLGELAKHPIAFLISSPEFKDNKTLRDKYIQENFPKNSDYFIESCDILLKGQQMK